MAERRYLTDLGHPTVNEAFSGLKTIIRRYKISGTALRVANVDDVNIGFRDYGTPDDEFPEALLIKFSVEAVESKPNTLDHFLTEIYSEFEDDQKTEVGEDIISWDESGRKTILKKYVSKAEDAEDVCAEIGDLDGDGLACSGIVINMDGVGAQILETWIEAGQLSEVIRESHNGKLTTITLTYFNQIPPTPPGFVLVDRGTQNPNGVPTYTYTFAKGEGLISVTIDARGEGLRAVTHVSLGTKSIPPGVIVHDDTDELDGYFRYTVTAMQSSTGADPTTETFEYERYVPFTYPGRAKPYIVVIGVRTIIDLFQSPPIQSDVLATVTITYQASDTLAAIANYWDPDSWATMVVKMVTRYGEPLSIVRALPGYRAADESVYSFTAPNVVGEEASISGNLVYGGTTGTMQVKGGPEDPGNKTYTLEARLEPAFTATDGTKYYRKVAVVAAIPAQPAMPVLL